MVSRSETPELLYDKLLRVEELKVLTRNLSKWRSVISEREPFFSVKNMYVWKIIAELFSKKVNSVSIDYSM